MILREQRQLMKVELKAAAKLVGIDIRQAAKVVRTNPLLSEEVRIEESLVNLEESLATYKAAGSTLSRYPQMRKHVAVEQRYILYHCIGSIFRMIQGDKNLPTAYTEQETAWALKRLVRVLTSEALRVRKKIDEEIVEVFSPLLTSRQKFLLKHSHWAPLISAKSRVLTDRLFAAK